MWWSNNSRKKKRILVQKKNRKKALYLKETKTLGFLTSTNVGWNKKNPYFFSSLPPCSSTSIMAPMGRLVRSMVEWVDPWCGRVRSGLTRLDPNRPGSAHLVISARLILLSTFQSSSTSISLLYVCDPKGS